MSTAMQKDVLIELISGTMIDVRKIGTNEDINHLKLMRNAVYSLPCLQINYDEFIEDIEKIRVKYEV